MASSSCRPLALRPSAPAPLFPSPSAQCRLSAPKFVPHWPHPRSGEKAYCGTAMSTLPGPALPHANAGLRRGEPRRQAATSADVVSTSEVDVAVFLKGVAAVAPPPALPILLALLGAQGYAPLDPSQRQGLVPLLIPIALEPHSGRRLALLRWPTPPEGLELPLVSVEPNKTIRLLARSCPEHINRALAEEDAAAADKDRPLARAVAQAASLLPGTPHTLPIQLYQPGDFAASATPRLDVFLLKKVGPFPDILERLALSHLSNGDEVSALVTGEFYANPRHFPGWGRPFMFNAELLNKVGRASEARDAARIALRSPWWTLGVPYQEAAELAGYGDTMLEYALERVSDEGRKADLQKGKSPTQASLDQAAFLLDVATADNSWDSIRERLASLYQESGLPEVARFVRLT